MKKYLSLCMCLLLLFCSSYIVMADENDAFEIPYSSSYKYGVVNSSGKSIVSTKYLYVGNYHNGLAKAKDSVGWLYIDTAGREAFRASLCTEVGDFHDGLAKAKDSVGWKFYNTSGKEVFRASLCTEVGDFHDGLVKAKDSVGWKYYNTSGKEVFRLSLCTEVGDFHDGLVKAKDSVGWKYYNTSGNEAFRLSLCTEVGDFHDGLARAKDSVGWKFYNTNGREAFRVSGADVVSDCCNGYVIVAKGIQSGSGGEGSPEYVKPPSLPQRYDDSKFIVTNARIILNGEEQHFSVPTISYLDRTLVPMRELFEKLGTEVIWNGENQSITARTPTKDITMMINNQFVLSMGIHLVVDVPPMLYNSRTVVPLRFVCEQLHLNVEWDGATNTIYLTSKGEVSLKEEIADYGFKARYYGEYINDSIKDGMVIVQYFTGDDIYSGTIIDHLYQQYSNGQQITSIKYDDNGDLVSIIPMKDNTGMYYGPLTTDGTTNSQTYLGNITNGKPDGYGYVEYANGDRYYGYFEDGKKSGQGVYVWAYKSSEGAYFYSGEWANDQANGYGTYVWYDGLYHVGNFKNGDFDGYGTRYSTTGKVTKGYWEDGEFIN